MLLARDQRAEPAAASSKVLTLLNHLPDKGQLASRTPELVGLATKIEHGLFPRCLSLAAGQILHLAAGRGAGLFGTGVKRRIAERQIKLLLLAYDAAEDGVLPALLSERDGMRDGRIGRQYLCRILQ